jgi:ElaB/YqjD/DUF883 family membrane-anchored ribosome-binding protein
VTETKTPKKPDTPEVTAARIEAERSRARLMATAHELQERLNPKTMARDALQGAKEKGADLAEEAVDAVRTHPRAAGGAAAAVALFLARQPLIGLVGKLFRGPESTPKPSRRRKSRNNPENRNNQEDTETIE